MNVVVVEVVVEVAVEVVVEVVVEVAVEVVVAVDVEVVVDPLPCLDPPCHRLREWDSDVQDLWVEPLVVPEHGDQRKDPPPALAHQ